MEEARPGETLIENFMHEAMHGILEDGDLDELLDNAHFASSGMYATSVTNQAKPKREILTITEEDESEDFEDERE